MKRRIVTYLLIIISFAVRANEVVDSLYWQSNVYSLDLDFEEAKRIGHTWFDRGNYARSYYYLTKAYERYPFDTTVNKLLPQAAMYLNRKSVIPPLEKKYELYAEASWLHQSNESEGNKMCIYSEYYNENDGFSLRGTLNHDVEKVNVSHSIGFVNQSYNSDLDVMYKNLFREKMSYISVDYAAEASTILPKGWKVSLFGRFIYSNQKVVRYDFDSIAFKNDNNGSAATTKKGVLKAGESDYDNPGNNQGYNPNEWWVPSPTDYWGNQNQNIGGLPTDNNDKTNDPKEESSDNNNQNLNGNQVNGDNNNQNNNQNTNDYNQNWWNNNQGWWGNNDWWNQQGWNNTYYGWFNPYWFNPDYNPYYNPYYDYLINDYEQYYNNGGEEYEQRLRNFYLKEYNRIKHMSFLFGASATKYYKEHEFTFRTSFLANWRYNVYQIGSSYVWYPKGSLDLFFKARLFYLWRKQKQKINLKMVDRLDKRTEKCPLIEVAAGVKLFPRVWVEGAFLYGDLKGCEDSDINFVYLPSDDTRFRASFQAIVPIERGINLYLSYRLTDRIASTLSSDVNTFYAESADVYDHVLSLGVKWNFLEK